MTQSDGQAVVDYPMPVVGAIEPPPEWEQLRQQCPVAHVRLPSGDQASLLTRYDDVKQVLADPRFTRTAEDRMLVATGMGLLVAGHETTANMIGKMMAMLLSDRSRWEQLPTVELAVAVEELRPVEGLAVGGLREVPVRW